MVVMLLPGQLDAESMLLAALAVGHCAAQAVADGSFGSLQVLQLLSLQPRSSRSQHYCSARPSTPALCFAPQLLTPACCVALSMCAQDGVYPEKVNAGRSGDNTNMRRIGQNVNPVSIKFTGKVGQ